MRISNVNFYFHNTQNKGTAPMAKFIQKLKLDVLVALDSHLLDNRMDLLSYKLANVVCTVLGFACTTGCPDVHYFIGDTTVISPIQNSNYSEHIAYMPLSCYIGSHLHVYPQLTHVYRAETSNVSTRCL